MKLSRSLFEHDPFPPTFSETPTDKELAIWARKSRAAYDSAVLALNGVCEALQQLDMVAECMPVDPD